MAFAAEVPMSSLRFFWSLMSALGIQAFAVGILAAEDPTSQVLDAKGVKIHYLIAGKGEPVVLIHGLHSSAEINWKLTGVIRDLAADHQVIAIDLPGHGRSEKPVKEEAYGLQVVEDVILLLDHLNVKKAHVVGYSIGGLVALKLTSMHPDRVRSLLLGGMGWLRDGSALQKVWEKLPSSERGRTPAAFVRSVGKFALKESDLKKIDIPVKVVVGDRDPVKRLYVMPLQQVRKDWPVVDIKGAGHINCVVKEQFRDEVVSWVRANTK
jgi:pimeloyl-ACP methyl ester carboxylesterase